MNNSIPWITSQEQIEEASEESLRRALLTSDGAGTKIKEAVLDELLERRFQEGYMCVWRRM